MRVLPFVFLGLILCTLSCNDKKSNEQPKNEDVAEIKSDSFQKIKVLNFGTFHMSFSPDKHTTEFDEHDAKNQKQAQEIARKLASFKPTVIIVEHSPAGNDKLKGLYDSYLEDPEMSFEDPSEIHLIAFEVGRISGAQKIYGINHAMDYNYMIGRQMDNKIDPNYFKNFDNDLRSFYPEINIDRDTLNLLDKLKLYNHDQNLDYLITTNADLLTHVGSDTGFEGADEAAKYYQRNLRMFSNLNRLELSENDRVFILMGASHTAFFRDFLKRSPKYEMVDTFEYL